MSCLLGQCQIDVATLAKAWIGPGCHLLAKVAAVLTKRASLESIALAGLLVLSGCDHTVGPAPAPTIATPEVKQELNTSTSASTSPQPVPDESRRESDRIENVSNADSADAESIDTTLETTSIQTNAEVDGLTELDVNLDADPTAPSPPDPTATTEPAYRLWIPTSMGPLLVGLDVLIDDQPLREAFDQKLSMVRKAIGATEELQPTWDQLLEHVAGDPATFGQTASRVNGQEKMLIKRYDRNKDQRVDDQELTRFLFRDSNVNGEFRLFGTDAFRWANRSESPLFSAIDRNQDRKLDATEIDLAADALLREIDSNADQCIDFAESSRGRQNDNDAWRRNRSNRQGNVAMDLSGFVNWSDLSYAMGGLLEETSVLGPTNPVRSLDANRDEWISAEEAESVLGIDPAFSITVRFVSGEPVISTEVALTDAAESTTTIEQGADRCWIVGTAFQVGVTTSDTPTTGNRIPREVFRQLDADNNGAIDEGELPDVAKEQFPLEQLDADGDGKLSFMEINQTLGRKQSIWNVQVRGRAAEHPDAVFAWFDVDHDQFLSHREIVSVPERLHTLLDKSGTVPATKIPDTLMIQFGRGQPDQDEMRFEINRSDVSGTDPRPSWAIRMDANRDGDVSETEFIGPIKTFRGLDTDQDHFLSAAEVLEEH
ncbi:EF hand [Stieleria maiorica]|uniref:EF hand n=1 Tax=Stieleria maiorica TaxID=2795974 RepID=A0A5B9M9T8_9BACT|nr:EF-hand domain-containing protein [Stieleria maiorica]QEF97972.1 EF hand [Stieleria maiorica]